MTAEEYLLDIGFDDAHLPELFNDDDKSHYQIAELMESYHQSKAENLGIFSVSNSALSILEASKVLLRFDYTPTLGQEWLLAEKGKMTVLHRGKSKEELVNYVIEHYC